MTLISIRKHALVAGAVLALAPASAVAQNEVAEKADDVAQQAAEVERQADSLANDVTEDAGNQQYAAREENDDDFPWGLLGLLGLAGLLGLNRKDDRDIHVDARRDTRP